MTKQEAISILMNTAFLSSDFEKIEEAITIAARSLEKDIEEEGYDFKAGDEVIWTDLDEEFCAVVLDLDADKLYILTEVGCVEKVDYEDCELTGHHFEELDMIMRGLAGIGREDE